MTYGVTISLKPENYKAERPAKGRPRPGAVIIVKVQAPMMSSDRQNHWLIYDQTRTIHGIIPQQRIPEQIRAAFRAAEGIQQYKQFWWARVRRKHQLDLVEEAEWQEW